MLTEPLRGDLVNFDDKSDRYSGKTSYVPRAHVQLLEQAGIKVIPISYTDSEFDIRQQLDLVNGIYLPGDSAKTIIDPQYQ